MRKWETIWVKQPSLPASLQQNRVDVVYLSLLPVTSKRPSTYFILQDVVYNILRDQSLWAGRGAHEIICFVNKAYVKLPRLHAVVDVTKNVLKASFFFFNEKARTL